MRRKANECSTPEFFQLVLSQAEDLYLAINTEDFPYIIPINFVYVKGVLYLHCALEGTKLDLIARDNRVAFSTSIDVEIIREKATTLYKSVCGTGLASIITDKEEKRFALDCLGERYASICPRPSPDSALDRLCMVRIDILSMTGKQNNPKVDS